MKNTDAVTDQQKQMILFVHFQTRINERNTNKQEYSF